MLMGLFFCAFFFVSSHCYIAEANFKFYETEYLTIFLFIC